jgi:hypothetical protein
VIWAMPQMGYYDFQWYYSETHPGADNYIANMQAINADTLDIPWVIYFDQMPDGYYAVEVTNPAFCLRVSELYLHNVSSINRNEPARVVLYPNPVSTVLTIDLEDPGNTESIDLYDMTGRILKTTNDISGKVNLSLTDIQAGLYIIKVNKTNGSSDSYQIIKN